MKSFLCLSGLVFCLLLSGCGGSSYSPSNGGAAAVGSHNSRDVIRAGDKITIRLSGVPDSGFFTEFQVPPSGEISVDLLTQSFHAIGLTPDELGAQIAQAYKSQKIYTNPVVTVLPEERFITVSGDVRSPTRVVYSPDSTVMSTISACGGFTEYADRRHVRVIRGSQVVVVDCVKATQNPGADPSVSPGDQITVPRTVF